MVETTDIDDAETRRVLMRLLYLVFSGIGWREYWWWWWLLKWRAIPHPLATLLRLGGWVPRGMIRRKRELGANRLYDAQRYAGGKQQDILNIEDRYYIELEMKHYKDYKSKLVWEWSSMWLLFCIFPMSLLYLRDGWCLEYM